jgi:glutathione S-transferase
LSPPARSLAYAEDVSALEYHYFPNSHWSRAVSLVLAEKDLTPERRLVDIRKNANFDPAYMRLNPRGVVPTLVIDGDVVCGSPAIAARLEDVGPSMLPADDEPALASLTQELVDFPLMYHSYQVWILGLNGERSADILDDKVERAARYAERHPELADLYLRKRDFFTSFRDSLLDDSVRAETEASSRDTLGRISDVVRDQEWLGGERFTFADAIAASILWRLFDARTLDEWKAGHTPLSDYFDRLRARPSFRFVWEDDPLLAQL